MKNRSLLVPIRYSKPSKAATTLLFGALVIVPHVKLFAAPVKPGIQQQIEGIAADANLIHNNADLESLKELLPENNASYEQAKEEANAFLNQLQGANATLRELQVQSERERRVTGSVLIFASRSLGRPGLEAVIEAASGDPDVTVVFRGIPEGANLGEAIQEIQSIARDYDPVPHIIIDPTLFTEYSVEVVPTIIVRTESAEQGIERQKLIGRVAGLHRPEWLLGELQSRAEGEAVDKGTRGPVVAISEPDMIEEMKRRFLAINWEIKKEEAIKRAWQNQTFYQLPKAAKPKIRVLDPSIYVTRDIKDADGTVITAKGTTINPLMLRPFTQVLVVYDPLDDEQLALIKDKLPSALEKSGAWRTTYIVTQIDKEAGWDSYRAVTDAVDSPVFLLTHDVKTRFELEHVPSLVYASEDHFIIEELANATEESSQ